MPAPETLICGIIVFYIVMMAGFTWKHIEAVRAYERGEL